MNDFQKLQELFRDLLESVACGTCLGNGSLSGREDHVFVGTVEEHKIHHKCAACKGSGSLYDLTNLSETISGVVE